MDCQGGGQDSSVVHVFNCYAANPVSHYTTANAHGSHLVTNTVLFHNGVEIGTFAGLVMGLTDSE
jgi:hypothetical protein